MKISDLPIPEKIKDILRKDGIEDLNPPQAQAVEKGVLSGKNIVVATPTASGKTFIAEMAIIKNYLEGRKSLYLVPLKALASEKYEDFVRKYKNLGMRVAISTGDYDSGDSWLASYDLIVLSNEKMDSILRRNAPWVRDVTLIVTDEVHLINDPSRGPTLEIVLTKLRTMTNAQIIALSATIQNSDEIAKWLKAKLVSSNYRPVSLRKGIFYQTDDRCVIDFTDSEKSLELTKNDAEITLCTDTLKINKQALVFVGTRRSAEASADKLSSVIEKFLTVDEKKRLHEIADEIENTLSSPTKQCRRLANTVRHGAAFHHAGLVGAQRKAVEESFRLGLIKFIVSTPTLAFGVNLPAYRVLIRDAKRYDMESYGSYYIPNFEVQQMMGRAGRPKYDKEGEAIMIAKNSRDALDLKERYILGELEPIYSKLSIESVLRMHVLALIAGETARTKKQLEEFFSRTFFAHQYSDIDDVMRKVDKVLEELRSYDFIRMGEGDKFIGKDFVPAFSLTADVSLKATRIGKRVAELYIDPLSAKHLIDNMEIKNDMGYLTVINQCAELRPNLRVKKSEGLDAKLINMKIKVPDVWDLEYDDFLAAFKTALMFQDWMREAGEDRLLEKYNITPGELYTKTLNMDWMLYSAKEIAVLMGKQEAASKLNKLRLRVKYGVKEELLSLVELRGIGRARARNLFKNGVTSPVIILKTPREKIEKILGPKVAADIISQLSETREEKFQRIKRRN